MLDILSVVLSALGLYNSIRNERAADKKIDLLRTAARDVANLHVFLQELKGVHDGYEKLEGMSLTQFTAVILSTQKSLDDWKMATTEFLKWEPTIVTIRTLSPIVLNRDPTIAPAPIVLYLRNIFSHHPQLADALNAYDKNLAAIAAAPQQDIWGGAFQKATLNLRDQAGRAVQEADTLLLNALPLTTYLHDQMTQAL